MLDRLHPYIPPYPWDDHLIDSMEKDNSPKIHIYPFETAALVAGRGSQISKEIHLDSALSDGVPLYRREGGGCSVFLDPGNLIVSAVFPAPGFLNIGHHFNTCTQWLINGLKKTGLTHIYQDGISDIVLHHQKIGGTCFKRAKGLAYFSASILVSPDINLMEKYLKPPPRQPAYRQGRSHQNFVTSVNRFFNGISTLQFSDLLKSNLKLEALSAVV